jgi:hypothetical protein
MKRPPLVCMLLLALAASGCSDSDERNATRKKITLEPTIKAPVEDPTKKMATAVRVGKSTGDFELKYQFGTKPEVSTICPVEIALITQTPRQDVEVEIKGMDGIELDGQLTRTFDLKGNEPFLMRFTVVPLRIGVFYVTVTAKIATSPETVAEHSFAIPFIAGDLKALSAKPTTGEQPTEQKGRAANRTLSQATEKRDSDKNP